MHRLAGGIRVRLRLARIQDASAIEELLRETGTPVGELDVARLLRDDPRRNVTICASALIGSRETILGLGSITLGSDEPQLLVTDPEHAADIEPLLRLALRSRAAAIASRLAA